MEEESPGCSVGKQSSLERIDREGNGEEGVYSEKSNSIEPDLRCWLEVYLVSWILMRKKKKEKLYLRKIDFCSPTKDRVRWSKL